MILLQYGTFTCDFGTVESDSHQRLIEEQCVFQAKDAFSRDAIVAQVDRLQALCQSLSNIFYTMMYESVIHSEALYVRTSAQERVHDNELYAPAHEPPNSWLDTSAGCSISPVFANRCPASVRTSLRTRDQCPHPVNTANVVGNKIIA